MSAMGYFRRFDAIRFYVGYHSDSLYIIELLLQVWINNFGLLPLWRQPEMFFCIFRYYLQF